MFKVVHQYRIGFIVGFVAHLNVGPSGVGIICPMSVRTVLIRICAPLSWLQIVCHLLLDVGQKLTCTNISGHIFCLGRHLNIKVGPTSDIFIFTLA